MNKRLAQFIEYKTGGNQKEFAQLIGWSPQYLHKMLKGDSMGIQPVISLLQVFPELNARWLILGEGFMVNSITSRIFGLLKLEEYIPVMNREELSELEGGKTDFDEATRTRWRNELDKMQENIDSHFREAYRKQQKMAKKS